MLKSNAADVSNLKDLGLTEKDAIDCLKACNNDVDKAAEYYFSGDLEKNRKNISWDESAFHSDRYDNLEPLEPLTGWGPQNVNNSPRTSTRSAASFSHLSLPMMRYLEIQESSRTGTPLRGGGEEVGGGDDGVGGGGVVGFEDENIMDYHGGSERATAYSSSDSNVDYSIQGPDVLSNDAMGPRPSSPMNSGMNDANRQSDDLARAMRLSLADTYNTNPDYDWEGQETGITGGHSTPTQLFFGPATKPDYDPTDWALTTISATHEIYLDPANPNQRKRKEGEPAFFKPSSDGYYLGPALAIFHSIPLAREALLARVKILDDYGYNERWWSGEAIEASRITNFIEQEGLDLIEDIQPSEVVVEVQRLMAFLSLTKRGYGSVDSLAKMRNVFEEQQGVQLSTFFKTWTTDVRFLSEIAARPFMTTAVIADPAAEDKTENAFSVMELDIVEGFEGKTLYDLIDGIVWPQALNGATDYAFKNVGDIFCISTKRNTSSGNKGIGIDIPVNLYLDRYTLAFAEAVKDAKSNRLATYAKIQNLEARERSLRSCPVGKNNLNRKEVETSKLFEAAIGHFEFLRLPSEGSKPAEQNEDGDVEMTSQTPEEVHPIQAMSSQLKGVLERLKLRLEELAKAKDDASRTLKELSTAFTSPETTPEGSPQLRRHTLRGVFTDLSTTFIKLPNQATTEENTTEVTEQWWCLSYPLRWESGSNSSAYKVHRVTEREVLEAVKYTGEGMTLMIYATDEAMKPIEAEIPIPLQNFVARDNQAFADELNDMNDPADSNGGNNSAKRKRFAASGSNHPPPSAKNTWWKNGYSNDNLVINESDEGNLYDSGNGLHQPPTSPTDDDSARDRRPLKVMNPVAEVDPEDGGVAVSGVDRSTSPTLSHGSTVGRPQKKSPDSSWFAQGLSTIPGGGEGGVTRGEASNTGSNVGGGGATWDDRTGQNVQGDYGSAGYTKLSDQAGIGFDEELPSYSSLQEIAGSDGQERRYDGNIVAAPMPRPYLTRNSSSSGNRDQYGWETFPPTQTEKQASIASTPTSATLSGDDTAMRDAPSEHIEFSKTSPSGEPTAPTSPGSNSGVRSGEGSVTGSVKRKKVQIRDD